MSNTLERKLKKARAVAGVYGTNLAVDLRLVPGDRCSVRFIILARGRSGSNLLRSLIQSHSRTRTFGELFRRRDLIGWDTDGYVWAHRGLRLFHDDPVRFLERKDFRKYPERYRAVGFKLFYTHARQDDWQGVWPYIKESGLRIIHLRRRNILAAICRCNALFRPTNGRTAQARTIPTLRLSSTTGCV